MSGSSQSSQSSTGMNVIQGYINELFGGNTIVSRKKQIQPGGFNTGSGVFTPEMFSALPGLFQNQPLTGTDKDILANAQQTGWAGAQNAFGQVNAALPGYLNADAATAAANRGFTQDTLPAILEKTPGFSSSDLQREVTRAGTDLQTNIAAMKEANVGQALQAVPQYLQGYLDTASQNLGFGQIGRELVRDTSPAGDAFRVLSMFASLAGGGTSQGTGSTKSGGV